MPLFLSKALFDAFIMTSSFGAGKAFRVDLLQETKKPLDISLQLELNHASLPSGG